MRYYLLHEGEDDPILSWVDNQRLEDELAHTDPSHLKRMVVEGYLEDEHDSEGVNECLAAIPAELALNRLKNDEDPVQLRDS